MAAVVTILSTAPVGGWWHVVPRHVVLRLQQKLWKEDRDDHRQTVTEPGDKLVVNLDVELVARTCHSRRCPHVSSHTTHNDTTIKKREPCRYVGGVEGHVGTPVIPLPVRSM